MVAQLKIDLNGRQEFSRTLDGVSTQLNDWSPVFEQMEADFYRTQRAIFAGQGAFEGFPKWSPLADGYRAWKQRHFPGRPLLVLTGRLRSMLTGTGRGLNVRTTTNSMTITADYPVGRWNLVELHTTGTRKMPPRPPFRLTDPEKVRWHKFMHEYLLEEILESRRKR